MLKILSFNIYFNPVDWFYKRPTNYVPPSLRLQRITRFIGRQSQEFDLCVLQEFWGPMAIEFHEEMLKLGYRCVDESSFGIGGGGGGGFIGTFFEKWSSQCRKSDQNSWSTFAYHFCSSLYYSGWIVNRCKLGGLTIFYKPEKVIPVTLNIRYTFPVSETSSKKGLQIVLFKSCNVQSGSTREKEGTDYWLICNTHLDAFNSDNKIEQLAHLSKGIRESLPKNVENFKILLLGDLNIPAHDRALYERMINALAPFNVSDLYRQCNPSDHDKSEHFTYDGNTNSLVTHPQNSGRIDYALQLHRQQRENDDSKSSSFKVHFERTRGDEMSDHWPLIVEIIN